MAAKWKILKTDKLFSVNTKFRNPLQNFSFLTVTSSEIRTTFTFEGFLPESEKRFWPLQRFTGCDKNFNPAESGAGVNRQLGAKFLPVPPSGILKHKRDPDKFGQSLSYFYLQAFCIIPFSF